METRGLGFVSDRGPAAQSGNTKGDYVENVDDRSSKRVKSHAVPFEKVHDKADTASNN